MKSKFIKVSNNNVENSYVVTNREDDKVKIIGNRPKSPSKLSVKELEKKLRNALVFREFYRDKGMIQDVGVYDKLIYDIKKYLKKAKVREASKK